MAREMAMMNAATIPDTAAGSTTRTVVSSRVEPNPYEASRSEPGTALSASSLIDATSGRIMMPITSPADATLKISTVLAPNTPCRSGVMNCSAKNPYTTVGMPASTSRMGLIVLRTFGLAYSLR